VAVPTLAQKNRADVCETAAIYSLLLLAWFLLLSPHVVQVSHSNSESWCQLAIRMSFVGGLQRVGPDRFHSCFVFSHTSESARMLVVSDFPKAFTEKLIELVKIYPILYDLFALRLQKREEEEESMGTDRCRVERKQ